MDWIKPVVWPVTVALAILAATICILVIYGHVSLEGLASFLTLVAVTIIGAIQKGAKDQANRIEANSNGTLAAKDAKIDELTKLVAILASKLPTDTPLPKPLAALDNPDPRG